MKRNHCMALSGLVLALALGGCADDGDSEPASSAEDTVQEDGSTDASESADSTDAATEAEQDSEEADTTEQPDTATPEPLPTELTVEGERPATVVLPDGYDGTTPLAVVFVLGGYDYFGFELDEWIALSGRASERGFLAVLPDGTVDEAGSPFWNATDTCCDDFGTGVDDVGYLTSLLDLVEATYPTDGQGAVLVGHSNGGFMAYRLACEVPERLRAIVSIAGSGYLDEELCASPAPLPVLQVHGTLDDIMPFGGDYLAPGALEMGARWAERNTCAGDAYDESVSSTDLTDDGTQPDTDISVWPGCPDSTPVVLWTIDGADHYPEFTTDFVPQILDFALGQ